MIYFGKDLAESERRFAVLQTGYMALCCWIATPALLMFWHFRPHHWMAVGFAAFTVVGGIIATLKCMGAGRERTLCDCEERDSGTGR